MKIQRPLISLLVRLVVMISTGRRSRLRLCCQAWHAEASRIRSTFLGYGRFRVHSQRRSFVRPSGLYMMPEGPEVRTLLDQLQQGGAIGHRLVDVRFLSGRYVRHGRPRGFQEFAVTMTPWSQQGNRSHEDSTTVDVIQEWNAKGKFIYMILDEGLNPPPAEIKEGYQRSIWITLGMSGGFVSENVHLQDPRFARWVLEMLDPVTGAIRKIFYHDARNFGTLRFCLSAEELQEKLDSLGLDILEPETTTEDKFLALVDRQRPDLNVCKFLMDQSKLSGIGNYILSECLYRANIDPFASLCEIPKDQRRRLFQEAQAVAIESYRSQGLTRKGGSFRNVEGEKGKFEFELQCYGRETCARGKPVLTEKEGPHNRAIWYVEDQLTMPLVQRMQGGVGTSLLEPPSPMETMLSVQYANSGGYGRIDLRNALTDNGWKNVLSSAMQSDSFRNLESFLAEEEASGAVIYPRADEVFQALNLCPFDKVKVVICGQDPYHGPGQADGLAFSVQRGVALPPSLKNIFRELVDDMLLSKPMHGNLEAWAKEGVLLLNTVLTVRQGEANSHKGRGWEEFSDEIIQVLNDQKKDGIVFLLWGNPAAKKAARVDSVKHTIIRTSHPSPLGATKTDSPFLSSRCFSKANDALTTMGHYPIDWTLKYGKSTEQSTEQTKIED